MWEAVVKVVHDLVGAIPGIKTPYGLAAFFFVVMLVWEIPRLLRVSLVFKLSEADRASAFKRETRRAFRFDLFAAPLVAGLLVTVIVIVERQHPDISKPSLLAKYVLTIGSTPEGADIFIDNEPAGATPKTVNIAEGTHKVTVRKEGYKQASDPQVAVPQRDTLFFPLEHE